MNLKQVLKFNFISTQCFRRKIHNYATIYESNDSKNIGRRTKIKGWVRAHRKMKHNIFLDINDGTSNVPLQVVIKKEMQPKNLSYGCSISAEGEITLAANGRIELQAENINIIGDCTFEGYPFLPRKSYSSDYIRQYLHLRPRTKNFSSTLRLRDLASGVIRDHFRNHGFINIDTPILTANDCEGAGEVFLVQPNSKELIKEMKTNGIDDVEATYFNTKTFLSVSGQLHLEACARALSKVYNFTPAFRAENNKSRLHLSEFYMIEAEIAFISSLKELATEIELLLKSITINLITRGESDLQSIEAPKTTWIDKDFGYITYEEAIEILNKNSSKLTIPIKNGENFAKEHELFLVHYHGDIPVFITEWPKNVKPFYVKECDNDDSKVKALDLLVPTVGELIGGSVREDDYIKLQSRIPQDLQLNWYMDLRKYGNIPTAGYGMGFERFLQLILGVSNIKDVIPFPRWPHNCSL